VQNNGVLQGDLAERATTYTHNTADLGQWVAKKAAAAHAGTAEGRKSVTCSTEGAPHLTAHLR
jgi:hypothetical protein